MADCCPFCGAELSFAAERCRDCNLSQDPNVTPALSADDDLDEVAYEVADWPVGSRLRLTSVLAERGIPWRWESGLNLVVREGDDVRTEAALDEIEAEELGTTAANAPDPGDGADDASGDWVDSESPEEDEDDDEDDIVGEGVEDYDDELLDEDNEEDDEDEDDGAVAQAAMADLFVAADRLIHDPANLEFAVDLDTAADVIDASPAPFGIDDGTWSTIRALAAAVRAALDEPDHEALDEPEPQAEADLDPPAGDEVDGRATDGEIDGVDTDFVAEAVVSERAQVLRDTIRPWV